MTLADRFLRIERAGAAAGLVGLLAWAIGVLAGGTPLVVSYLVAFTFWTGLSLGCLALAMIHNLTGGRWGFVVRRFLEAGTMVIPLFSLLFVGLLVGLPTLYPWARAGAAESSRVIKNLSPYLSIPAYLVRSVLYLGIWSAIAMLLRRWSLRQDRTTDPGPTVRMRRLSGPGLVVLALTVAFAFIDWVMSTEPTWFSTMFPVIVMAGQVLSAIACVIVVLFAVRAHRPFAERLETVHFHHLGNLLLAFVMFWTYVAFSQVLIIYSGDLPREIDWYLHRTHGGWRAVAILLALFHFFLPFFALLFRPFKRRPDRLVWIAGTVLVAHAVAVYWTVVPAFPGHHGPMALFGDAAAFVGLGGVWIARFARSVRRHALLPVGDPRIEYSTESLAHAD